MTRRLSLMLAFLLGACALRGEPPPPAPAPEPAAPAAPSAVPPDDLNRAIEEVIARPAYAWRMPRERPERTGDPAEPGWLASFFDDLGERMDRAFKAVGRWLRKLEDWLDRRMRRPDRTPEETPANWQMQAQGLLFVLLAASACVLAIVVYRHLRRREKPVVAATPRPELGDVLREDVLATHWPSDEWMRLARDLLARGELRLALRALFLAALAALAAAGWLTIVLSKSNRDYLRELRRRARDRPEVLAAFERTLSAFERTWYGAHPLTADGVDECLQDQEFILNASVPPS